jgi:dihydrodipicolinate synthase/N-acetylneuraminate lyase
MTRMFGVAPPMITPFDLDGNPDEGGLKRLVEAW